MIRTVLILLLIAGFYPAYSQGALSGERYRVVISSDIGGSDDDDIQSFIHYLVYSDLFDTQGLISSPPDKGRAKDFLRVIDVYARDYPALSSHSPGYPRPDSLRAVVVQGALEPAPDSGYSAPTAGSEWLIRCARKADGRPLYVLVWGSITDLAQALHDAPDIKEVIRVYFIASWNRLQDEHAFAYIEHNHPDLWIIQCETTFRGWFAGGVQDNDWGNRTFVNTCIKGHGALGDLFAPLKDNSIKMGDTPSVAWLLHGNPADPSSPSWGGQFIKHPDRPNWWIDNPDPKLAEGNYPGAVTVNKWRKDYLSDWRRRMDRCLPPPKIIESKDKDR